MTNQIQPCGLTSDDFLGALIDLLPRGRAWQGRNLRQLLAGIADNFLRFQQRSCDLSEVESFPGTAVEMLPDWERALGLPDPCITDAQTIVQRQAAVIARLAGGFDPTAENFVALAASLGFTITITQFPPARFGIAHFGDRFGGAYRFYWQVNAPLNTVNNATFGQSVFGERFRNWGNALLECTFETLKPDHTNIIFAYS